MILSASVGPSTNSITRAPGRFVLFESVDRGDIGMIESSQCAGFPTENGSSMAVCHEFGTEDFDGDIAVEPLIVSPIDDAHASGAEFIHDAKLVMRLANHGERRTVVVVPKKLLRESQKGTNLT